MENVEIKEILEKAVEKAKEDAKKEVEKLIYFGMKLNELKRSYCFNKIVKFLKGDNEESYYFGELKPLYDEYGYEFTNEWVLKVAEEDNKAEEAGDNE